MGKYMGRNMCSMPAHDDVMSDEHMHFDARTFTQQPLFSWL